VKIVDGNVLIYAVNTRADQHVACRQWLESAIAGDEEIGLGWIPIGAFLRVATHPRVFEKPLTVAAAVNQVQQWFDAPRVRVVVPHLEHWTTFNELLLAVGTGGKLVTDAHLAALAISHNATLVSCDTDFARFRRLKWENPLAVP
jgi:toxin-antitoxin system PIN domain toxin